MGKCFILICPDRNSFVLNQLQTCRTSLSVKPGIDQAVVDPHYLSGTKTSNLDLGGNVFDINYCRQIQQLRLCLSAPLCDNSCSLGYKTNVHGCIASCECKILDPGETVLVSFPVVSLQISAVKLFNYGDIS